MNSKPPTIPFGIVACTFPTAFLEIVVYLTYAAFRAHAVLTSLKDILALLEQILASSSLVFLVGEAARGRLSCSISSTSNQF